MYRLEENYRMETESKSTDMVIMPLQEIGSYPDSSLM